MHASTQGIIMGAFKIKPNKEDLGIFMHIPLRPIQELSRHIQAFKPLVYSEP